MKLTLALLAVLAALLWQVQSRSCDVDRDKKGPDDPSCPVANERFVTKRFCVHYGSPGTTHASFECHKPFKYKSFWIKDWVHDEKAEMIKCQESDRGALACMGPKFHQLLCVIDALTPRSRGWSAQVFVVR
ncbi:unnamed protein product [Zymoseptoria tritici ST99CH_1A5]|uniref:Uncharacterized protein n=1 Tax=Zymoseptoria tritici ST99CH_1A5 TaxID=1276529 RepID=A0A1Y6LVY8_ZYMTR|nr:unnamed protein product [Zymoseptoria tritici ST99CH_1A5]